MKEKEVYKNFLKKLKNKEKIDFINIPCPFLNGSLCIIYNERPSCCRNFPNKEGICADYECDLLNSDPDVEACKLCKNQCCARISYPKNMEINKKFVNNLLNMDCKTCSELYKEYNWEWD